MKMGRRGKGVELFLSTPSARRATLLDGCSVSYTVISIHALREESDICQLGYQNAQLVFLSTPSARRATLPSMGRVIR